MPDLPHILPELQTGCIGGIIIGVFIGLNDFMTSDTDLWFCTVISLSIAAATIVSRLFKFFALWILHNHDNNLAEFVMAGCHDFIICLVLKLVTYSLYSIWPGGDD